MPRFDPHRMMEPAEQVAEILLGQSYAPAMVVEIDYGTRSVRYASGLADIESGEPALPSHTFEIGSQTKMMTAALALQLADSGRIDLDARISDYLPRSVLDGIDNAAQATVRDLLSMTSGIPNYTNAEGASGLPLFAERLLAGETFGPEEALEVARGMTPGSERGDYAYSNTNYLLLGMIIEERTGKSLARLMEDRIFKPLGMEDTTARPFSSDDPRLDSYVVLPDGEMIEVTDAPWHFKGEAGVVSTAGDMIDFLRALVSPGGLLSASARRQMMDFEVAERGDGYVMSFGLGLTKFRIDNGESFIGFTGGTLGTASSTYISLKTGAAVSIAGNGPDLATAAGAFAMAEMLAASSAWTPETGRGPLRIKDVSAAETSFGIEGHVLHVEADGARMALGQTLRDLTTRDLRFSDGSLLIVGDGKRGGADNGANDIDIIRDRPAADGKANHLVGLGGDDRLRGGAGNEWLEGNRGDDTLYGGGGDDRIEGGAGHDLLFGGDGADSFVFKADFVRKDAVHGDTIADFVSGTDRIDLRAFDGVPGGRNDALRWMGEAQFDGEAGALRFERSGADLSLLIDLNGDGAADVSILLTDTSLIDRADLLL